MNVLLSIISTLSAFFTGVIINDVNSIKVKRYNLSSKKVKKDIKICLMADLHGKSFGNDNDRLIKAIDAEKPDIIVMAGDIISAKLVLKKDHAINICKKLAEKYPVYYGIGNHEKCLEEEPEKFGYSLDNLKDALFFSGIHMMDNRREHLKEYNIDISGLNLPRKFFKRTKNNELDNNGIEEYVGTHNDEVFELLIGHCPDYFDIYAKHGADLSVAGHLHGGVMGLPGGKGFISPKFRFFPKYSGGLFKMGKSRMIVSRGLGMHTIPIRVFNPSELVVINLKSTN